MNTKTSMALAAMLTCGAMSTAHAQLVFDYASRWTLDDCSTSSSTLADTAGTVNAVRGSFVQCAADADTRPNGAVSFTTSSPGDGTAQTTVAVKNAGFFRVSNRFTASVRIRPGAVSEGAVLTKGWTSSTGPRKTFQLGIRRDAFGVARPEATVWLTPVSGTTPVAVTLTSTTKKIDLANWTQLGVSYSPEQGLVLWVNNEVVDAKAETRVIADEPTNGVTGSVWMGGSLAAQTRGYTGLLDDAWLSQGGCADIREARPIVNDKELIVKVGHVVNDARTKQFGHWSFGWLMEQMVLAGADSQDRAAVMVENMFKTWINETTVNGFKVSARPAVNGMLLDSGQWPRLPNGKLNLAAAPMKLLAIVNRLDLHDLKNGKAGEGRFVFGVMDPNDLEGEFGAPQFTIILEYNLPGKTDADLRRWAKDWHALSTITDPLAYRDKLQTITDRFATRGSAPSRPNGNAISQVRTNELRIGAPWELREFALTQESATVPAALKASPVALTPNSGTFAGENLNNTPLLRDFINAKASLIVDSKHDMLPTFQGVKFQGGSSPVDGNHMIWRATGVNPSGTASAAQVLRLFALNTCNGCHSAETGVSFTHVKPREGTDEAGLSSFLTGGPSVPDPRGTQANPGFPMSFNDLGNRNTLMDKVMACTAPASSALASSSLLSASRVAAAPVSTSTSTQKVPAIGTVVVPVNQKTTSRVH
jgi:hypothetical protein